MSRKRKKAQVSPPRNHAALALRQRGGSTVKHGKSEKAQRRADKVGLVKKVNSCP